MINPTFFIALVLSLIVIAVMELRIWRKLRELERYHEVELEDHSVIMDILRMIQTRLENEDKRTFKNTIQLIKVIGMFQEDMNDALQKLNSNVCTVKFRVDKMDVKKEKILEQLIEENFMGFNEWKTWKPKVSKTVVKEYLTTGTAKSSKPKVSSTVKTKKIKFKAKGGE